MRIKGLEQAIKRLTVDENKIKQALEQGGKLILEQTRSSIQSQSGVLASSYNMRVTRDDNGWVVNVGSDLYLAAFFEFGTGDFVVVPSEVTDSYTMQWFVNGKGKLHAVPHLYPAWRMVAPKIVESIKKSLSL